MYLLWPVEAVGVYGTGEVEELGVSIECVTLAVRPMRSRQALAFQWPLVLEEMDLLQSVRRGPTAPTHHLVQLSLSAEAAADQVGLALPLYMPVSMVDQGEADAMSAVHQVVPVRAVKDSKAERARLSD